MTVSAGLGIANFQFDNADGFWDWVDLCEDSGVNSLWQSDRLIGTDPNLECMSVMAALAAEVCSARAAFCWVISSISVIA